MSVAELRGAAPIMPIRFGASADSVVLSAYRDYQDALGASRELVADKREILRLYDVPGMTRAAAICHCSRSGSLLLASYFDGHPDTVTLPLLSGEQIYHCFKKHRGLSVWEKLIVYRTYSVLANPEEGDFPIGTADYYAAVHALYEAYGDRPTAWLNERQRYFQFLHVAYAVGTGRRPGSSRPMMIYAQHWVDQDLAECFIEDFPGAQFIHTIRDPISAIDSWFDRQVEMDIAKSGHCPEAAPRFLDAAAASILNFLDWDHAHRGMEPRSRAVRFEDMHMMHEATMRRLAEWLHIAYSPCMLESTWNGRPYVVESGGVSWCGPNPANVRRREKNFNRLDRAMMCALLHDNFNAWGYPNTQAPARRWQRAALLALCFWVPMRMEIKNARLVWRLQVLPNLRRGRFSVAITAPLFLLKRRLRIMARIAAEAGVRLVGKRTVLELL